MLKETSLSGKTKIYCLIGHPVEHSMSPTMWNPALKDLGLNYVYIACDVHPDNLVKAINGIKALGIEGFNVTLPYKESIIKFLDQIDPIAKNIGAVNTIKLENGLLSGKNTDAEGGKKALINAGFEIVGKKILILGAGGAGRAISFILAQDSSKIVIANRTESRAKKLANEIQNYTKINVKGTNNSNSTLKKEIEHADILINTTSVGMHPNIGNTPISKELLHENLTVFDIIYNPLKTQLLKDAEQRGCQILGGLDMLIYQGALAFEYFTGKKPNIDLMKNKIIESMGMK